MEILSYGRKRGGRLTPGSNAPTSIIEEAQERNEIRGDVDSSELATLVVSTLEGSLMRTRLQRKENPRPWACRHLEEYLETHVCAKKFKRSAKKS